MRLFTAIDLPEDHLRKLERLLATLRPEAQINWSPIDNLHITTKFIGSWPQSRLPELTTALERCPSPSGFTVQLQKLGWFPDAARPRVLFLGITPCPSLSTLASGLESALEPLGIARDDRPYTPHLTLARIRHPAPLGRLRERFSELGDISLGEFTATRFCLYESQTGTNGSNYRKLAQFPLPTAIPASI